MFLGVAPGDVTSQPVRGEPRAAIARPTSRCPQGRPRDACADDSGVRLPARESEGSMTDYVVKPLDPSTWDAFARLVERHNGVFGGCWCTWFHTFHGEKTFTAEGNHALKSDWSRRGARMQRSCSTATRQSRGPSTALRRSCRTSTTARSTRKHATPARLPDHLHLRRQEVPAQRRDGGRTRAAPWI